MVDVRLRSTRLTHDTWDKQSLPCSGHGKAERHSTLHAWEMRFSELLLLRPCL